MDDVPRQARQSMVADAVAGPGYDARNGPEAGCAQSGQRTADRMARYRGMQRNAASGIPGSARAAW
jgi:hypothetical protein